MNDRRSAGGDEKHPNPHIPLYDLLLDSVIDALLWRRMALNFILLRPG